MQPSCKTTSDREKEREREREREMEKVTRGWR